MLDDAATGMILYRGRCERETTTITLGELEKRLNSSAFHADIHGFESRTRHLPGQLAQLGERLPYKQRVGGSSPSLSIGAVAQLVRAPACHAGGRGFETHLRRMLR